MQDDLMNRLSAAASSGQGQTQSQGQIQPQMQDNTSVTDSTGADLMHRLQVATDSQPIKMVGPSGATATVPSSGVPAYRHSNFTVSPDNPGVSKMITPDGQITYALPQEVQNFLASGHVLVNQDGTFNVTPLPGEDPSDTMARAARIGKAVTPEMLQAEERKMTPKRVAANLVAAPLIGAATTAGIAGASGGVSGFVTPTTTTGTVVTGIDAAGNPIMSTVTATSPSMLSSSLQALKTAATSPLALEAYKYMLKGAAMTAGGGLLYKLGHAWLSKGE